MKKKSLHSFHMTPPASGVISLALDRPFAHALADHWKPEDAHAPPSIWLVPNQRLCSEVRHALGQRSFATARLPMIRTPNDFSPELWLSMLGAKTEHHEPSQATAHEHFIQALTSIPPIVPSALRDALLIHLISRFRQKTNRTRLTAHRLLNYAKSVNEVLQDMILERVDDQHFEEGLAASTSEHSREHLLFFKEVLFHYWPKILESHGVIEHTDFEWAITQITLAAWQKNPPQQDVIIAGATGARPTTAALMAGVRRLPRGLVILPGFDESCSREEVVATPTHPFYAMARWLKDEKVSCTTLVCSKKSTLISRRVKQLLDALELNPTSSPADGDMFQITCQHEQEEAQTIVSLIQEKWQEKWEETSNNAAFTNLSPCLLLCPDHTLSARIKALLDHRKIPYHDAHNPTLITLPLGRWIMQATRILTGKRNYTQIADLIWHPLTKIDATHAQRHRYLNAWLEMPPTGTPQDLVENLVADETLCDLAQSLATQLRTLFRASDGAHDLHWWMSILDHILHDLVKKEDNDTATQASFTAWHDLVVQITRFSKDHPPLTGRELVDLLLVLLSSTSVSLPTEHEGQVAVAISTPFLGRFSTAQTVILAGFNDEGWPGKNINLWLNKQARRNLGMADPDTKIGLLTLDLLHLCTNRQIYFIRAKRRGHQPTVASRWLRLWKDYIPGADDIKQRMLEMQGIDQIALHPRPMPAPSPPPKHRPQSISITQLSMLVRDPYRFYTEVILGLKPRLLFEDQAKRHFGIAFHDALSSFLEPYRDQPENLAHQSRSDLANSLLKLANTSLEARGLNAHTDNLLRSEVMTILCHNLVDQVLLAVQEKHLGSFGLEQSIKGSLPLTKGKVLALYGRCDRIDFGDNQCHIIDYKTGNVLKKYILNGSDPQLGLEAWLSSQMVRFKKQPVQSVSLWSIETHGEVKITEVIVDPETFDLQRFMETLQPLLHHYFSDPKATFAPRDRPLSFINSSPQLRHIHTLSRHFEWQMIDGE